MQSSLVRLSCGSISGWWDRCDAMICNLDCPNYTSQVFNLIVSIQYSPACPFGEQYFDKQPATKADSSILGYVSACVGFIGPPILL
jgi:hypothetical protein